MRIQLWHRNVNGLYHADSENWIQSGKAVCGRKISHPAYVHSGTPQLYQSCKDCHKRLNVKEAS